MKMPTIVGIFIFISRDNFILNWAEYEKSFITSGPEQYTSDQTPHSAASDQGLHCLPLSNIALDKSR